MKTNDEWNNRENELKILMEKRDKLKAELKELSKEIHCKSIGIRQHKQLKKTNTNTIVYQMFGKRLKDLTKEEYRIYCKERQRINRKKKRSNNTPDESLKIKTKRA